MTARRLNNIIFVRKESMTEEKPKRLLILGAGVCGLYAAYKAAKQGKLVTVLEKADHVGGLAAGSKVGENHADLGVHMLHAFDREVFEDICQIMGAERIEVALDARIQWGGKSFKYPLKFGDMLTSMNRVLLAHCVLGLLLAEARRMLRKNEIVDHHAEDALITYYGAPLYEYFFEGFTHRYWGIHPRELSAEFVKRKMPRLGAVDVIRKALQSIGLSNGKDELVNNALEEEILHYSETGAETMVRRMQQACEQLGVQVITAAQIQSLALKDNQVSSCHYIRDNADLKLTVPCDQVISTVPLPDLAQMLGGALTDEAQHAAAQLRYKPITVFSILVNRERCMDGLYTYYRDRIFHRVGEPKNAGLKVTPSSASLLIVEMTCEVGDEKWTAAVKGLVIADLEKEGICVESDILEIHQRHYAHGYPVYSLGFETHLDTVNAALGAVSNLKSVGRQGGFCFPAMHKAMRMGADAVSP